MKTTDPMLSALERVEELERFYDVAAVTLAGLVRLIDVPGGACPVRPHVVWTEVWPQDGKLRPGQAPRPGPDPFVMIVVEWSRRNNVPATCIHSSFICADQRQRQLAASMVDVAVSHLAARWERLLTERA